MLFQCLPEQLPPQLLPGDATASPPVPFSRGKGNALGRSGVCWCAAFREAPAERISADTYLIRILNQSQGSSPVTVCPWQASLPIFHYKDDATDGELCDGGMGKPLPSSNKYPFPGILD